MILPENNFSNALLASCICRRICDGKTNLCVRINEDMAWYQHILSLQNKNNIVRCFEYRRLIEAGYSVLYGTGRAIDAENSLSIKQVSTLNTAIAPVALAESVSIHSLLKVVQK